MLKINQLNCGYDGKIVVKDVNLHIKKGQTQCIVGPNGCGKTTILKAIANLLDYEGEILLEGQNINTSNESILLKRLPS